VCFANPEVGVNEPVKALNMEFFSARLAPRVNDPVSALNKEIFFARPEARVIEELGFRLHAVGTPACRAHETDVVLEA